MMKIDINHTLHARNLFSCLQQFGIQRTNPVLKILDDALPEEQVHYPEQAFSFGSNQWRVFYHCHETSDQNTEGHGHFHFFVRSPEATQEKSDWSHVVAMSMDGMGQPVNWFTVNLWVTGGTWFRHEWFGKILTTLGKQSENSLLAQWFQAMLCLHGEELNYLLTLRDKNIAFMCQSPDLQSCFNDRDIYLLGVEPIDLLYKFETFLEITGTETDHKDSVA